MHGGGGAGRRCHSLVNDQRRSQLLECKLRGEFKRYLGEESPRQMDSKCKGPKT